MTRENNKGRLIFTIVQLLAMLFVLRIPAFIQEIYHFKIPYLLDFVLITFAFSGFILGDVFNFYGRIPYWDSVLHAFSGVVIAYVGFIVIEYLDKEFTIPLSVSPLFMSLIVVSVALAIGAIWEIGEYTVDDIFHTNNQPKIMIFYYLFSNFPFCQTQYLSFLLSSFLNVVFLPFPAAAA